MTVPQIGGGTREVPITGTFTVRRPEIVAVNAGEVALYRQCRNEVRIDVPGLEDRPLILNGTEARTLTLAIHPHDVELFRLVEQVEPRCHKPDHARKVGQRQRRHLARHRIERSVITIVAKPNKRLAPSPRIGKPAPRSRRGKRPVKGKTIRLKHAPLPSFADQGRVSLVCPSNGAESTRIRDDPEGHIESQIRCTDT